MTHRYYYIIATILLCCSSTAAFASLAVDSSYADSIYSGVALGVTSPLHVFGKPDSQFATIAIASGNSLELDIAFRRYNGSKPTTALLPIKRNSTVVVWGRKDTVGVDSSEGEITFNGFDNLGNLFSSQAFLLGDGENVIQVPDTDFQYIAITLPGVGLTPKYAQSYSIDAIALLEDTSQAAGAAFPSVPTQPDGLSASYPNPFIGATNLNFTTGESGNAEIAVIDALGNEHTRISLGYLQAGEHSERLVLNDPGMYLLRLFIDGVPRGSALKIISE